MHLVTHLSANVICFAVFLFNCFHRGGGRQGRAILGGEGVGKAGYDVFFSIQPIECLITLACRSLAGIMHPFSAYYFSAEVAKSVDAVDSKSTVEIRAGSSPAFGTIGTSIDVNGRLFLCLKSSIRKAFLAFSLNRSQSESTHIKSLVSIEPSIYVGSIMVVYSLRHMEGELLWL